MLGGNQHAMLWWATFWTVMALRPFEMPPSMAE
jgi:hypothetical protein